MIKTWYIHHFGSTWRMNEEQFSKFLKARMPDASVQPDKFGEKVDMHIVTLRDLDDMLDMVVSAHNDRIEQRRKQR